ncbi:MAG: 3'(2'),5'-bisphosphate nucleotidase CysQ [Cyclobacteriaceae bacterium]
MKVDLKELTKVAKKAALEAGKEILEIYHGDDFDVQLKGDNSPLTKADRAAHEVIVRYLADTEIPVLSEEGKDIPYTTRKDWKYFWMVDPLDGTKEFVKRNGEFTVNIALISDGKPVLGIVYAPVLDKLYHASEGMGAFLVEGGQDKQLRSNTFHRSDEGLNVVASRSHLNEATEEFLNALKNPNIVSMGSSLKFLVVAEGGAELYPRYAPTMEWDTAAAQVVVEQAGGFVYQEGTQTPVRYNKENLLNPYFLCKGSEQ